MPGQHDQQQQRSKVNPFLIPTNPAVPMGASATPAGTHDSALSAAANDTAAAASPPSSDDLMAAVGNYTDPPSYQQSEDPTLKPFLGSKHTLIGRQALDAEVNGRTPKDSDVRVSAVKSPLTTMGQGLHEIAPTSTRGYIAGIADPQVRQSAAEFQSGARTTPALQPMVTSSGSLTGHTGTFVAPSRPRASTHTSGQGDAHDRLRDAQKEAVSKGLSGMPFTVAMLNAHLNVTPHGTQLLNEDGFTGAHPNLKSIGGPLEPVSTTPAQNRLNYSIEVHRRREATKARTRGLKRKLSKLSQDQVRSPSPERKMLRTDGTGGDYVNGASWSEAVPSFPSQNSLAHAAAWATQPQRLDHKAAKQTGVASNSASTSSADSTAADLPSPASTSSSEVTDE